MSSKETTFERPATPWAPRPLDTGHLPKGSPEELRLEPVSEDAPPLVNPQNRFSFAQRRSIVSNVSNVDTIASATVSATQSGDSGDPEEVQEDVHFEEPLSMNSLASPRRRPSVGSDIKESVHPTSPVHSRGSSLVSESGIRPQGHRSSMASHPSPRRMSQLSSVALPPSPAWNPLQDRSRTPSASEVQPPPAAPEKSKVSGLRTMWNCLCRCWK